MAAKKSIPSATIELDGEVGKAFEIVRGHVKQSIPGIRPTAADVLRHAVIRTAESINGPLELTMNTDD